MFNLPDLPYGYDALAPAMSERTLHVHHDKHHATYVKTLNGLLPEGDDETLENVIRDNAGRGDKAKLFNNAAQAWNHGFFWVSMVPPGLGGPSGALRDAIDAAFGGHGELKKAFVAAGTEHFGSGWVWLVAGKDDALSVMATHDAKNMVSEADGTPLLVCDLWEHAYYLDYQNDRKGYLEAWFDALPNWALAETQLQAARGEAEGWRYPEPIAASRPA